MDEGTAALPELVMYGDDVVGACNRAVGVCGSPLSAVGTAALPELVMYGDDVVGACNRAVGVCGSPLSAVGFEPAIPVLCGCVSWELEGVGGVVSKLTVGEVFVSHGPVGKENTSGERLFDVPP